MNFERPANPTELPDYLTALWEAGADRQALHLALRSRQTVFLTEEATSTESWAIPHILSKLKANRVYGAKPVLLDAGCGGGYYLAHMLNVPGLPVEMGIGLDRDRAALETARSHLLKAPSPMALLEGSLLALPLATDSCGTVMCNRMLNQTGDIAVALSEAARVLTPGGALFIVTADSEQVGWLRATHENALRSLNFPPRLYEHSTRPDQRLNLQNGSSWLAPHFEEVRLLTYERRLSFNDPAILLEYYATGLLFGRSEGLTTSGVSLRDWAALYEVMAEVIRRQIETGGPLTFSDGAALFWAIRRHV